MNIKDVKEYIKVPETKVGIWTKIFEKQAKLAETYKDIEKMGDLLETTKNNPDTAKGQKWLKDFAWRVTEELAEAMEAKYAMNVLPFGDELVPEFQLHFKEELADALHFMVELTLIAGYDHTIVNIEEQHTLSKDPWTIVYNLGLLCNTLKNKPWKQTQMLTDRTNFEKYLKSSWSALHDFLIQHIGNDEEIYNFYFKKNKVNQFRQKSKY